MANNGLILLPARLHVSAKPPPIRDVHRAIFLKYGAELELVLIPKSHIANNWDNVAKDLSTALTERQILNKILEDTKTASFEEWIITGDGSVERDTKANKWGLELISYIRLLFMDWREECSNVWNTLTDRFEIVESDTCGTHVHVLD